MWATILTRLVVLVVNFSVQPNFNFADIVSLRQVSVFGERVSIIGSAVPRSQWNWLADVSLMLWLAYIIDAAVQRWLAGDRESRRKALATGYSVAVPLFCSAVYSQLVIYGVVHGPLSNIVWFLGAYLTMAYELGRDVVVSRRARLEMAELRTQLALSERVSVLGQLAPMLAHELSQPLAAALVNVEAARKILENPRPDLRMLRGIVGDIDSDDRRAAEIIDRMRRLLKRHSIEMRPLSVPDLLHDVVSLVEPEAASKQVELGLHIDPELPRVFGDRVHVSQVLLNLIMNSIHAVQCRPLNARYIVVEARARGAKDDVELAVRDSGPGVPDADEVFTPFFTTKPDGMGLGLSLARTIVDAHGGRLWIDRTTAGEGAVFRFTLRPV
jgi:signal transduction histidine kinase